MNESIFGHVTFPSLSLSKKERKAPPPCLDYGERRGGLTELTSQVREKAYSEGAKEKGKWDFDHESHLRALVVQRMSVQIQYLF